MRISVLGKQKACESVFISPKHSLYQMVTYTAKLTDSDVLNKSIQFIELLSLAQLKPCAAASVCGIQKLMLLHKTTNSHNIQIISTLELWE
jgi:hypothetical protein